MSYNPGNPYQAYSKATHTVSKTRQVVMLYDGVIRFVKQARQAIEDNRIEDRFNLINKASSVIIGLQACLDFEQGGDAAKTLYDFYSHIDMQLINIHRSNSLDDCDYVLNELKQMRDVWRKIDDGQMREDGSVEPPEGAEPKEPNEEQQELLNKLESITLSA